MIEHDLALIDSTSLLGIGEVRLLNEEALPERVTDPQSGRYRVVGDQGIKFARYADDIVIPARSADEAREALARIEQWMESAGLTLHPEKTRRPRTWS